MGTKRFLLLLPFVFCLPAKSQSLEDLRSELDDMDELMHVVSPTKNKKEARALLMRGQQIGKQIEELEKQRVAPEVGPKTEKARAAQEVEAAKQREKAGASDLLGQIRQGKALKPAGKRVVSAEPLVPRVKTPAASSVAATPSSALPTPSIQPKEIRAQAVGIRPQAPALLGAIQRGTSLEKTAVQARPTYTPEKTEEEKNQEALAAAAEKFAKAAENVRPATATGDTMQWKPGPGGKMVRDYKAEIKAQKKVEAGRKAQDGEDVVKEEEWELSDED